VRRGGRESTDASNSAAQDARAEADHETLTALYTMNVRQLQILEQQDKILEFLKQKSA